MDDNDALVQRLRSLGMQPIDPAQQSADLTAMAGVRPLRSRRQKLRTAGAVVAGLLIGSTGLAAADVLPDPAQHTAHTVLARVGVDVPNPARYYDAGACGAQEKKNHGAYVRDDHTLAESECGKPLSAVDPGQGSNTDHPTTTVDPCHGKPSWAGDKSLTKEERSAAMEARVAQCGDTEATDQSGQGTDDQGTEVDSTSTTTESESSSPTTEGHKGEGSDGPSANADQHDPLDAPPVDTQP